VDRPTSSYALRSDIAPESELSVLAVVYNYVLFDSQARRGGQRDLTSDSTKKWTTGPDKKGTDNADVHGN